MPLGAIKATPASAFPHQNIAMQVLLGTPGIENDYTCARLQESNNRLQKNGLCPHKKTLIAFALKNIITHACHNVFRSFLVMKYQGRAPHGFLKV